MQGYFECKTTLTVRELERKKSLYLYLMNFVLHVSFALEAACLLRQAKIATKPPRKMRRLDQIIMKRTGCQNGTHGLLV